MNGLHYAMLTAVAACLAVGQLLFKLSAQNLGSNAAPAGLLSLLGSVPFLSALVIYGLATLAWVYLLSQVPLSRAYPFMALSFVFTPILAHLVLHEALDVKFFAGTALLVLGVAVVAS